MNRNYKYSKSSLAKIATVSVMLQEVCHEAMRIANMRKMHCPDFGISYGLRTRHEQFDLYKKGRSFDGFEWHVVDRSKVLTYRDGHVLKSSHQYAQAIDFFAYVDGKANYEPANMALIATCFMEAADNLGQQFEWGGSFKSISDGGHFEIKL